MRRSRARPPQHGGPETVCVRMLQPYTGLMFLRAPSLMSRLTLSVAVLFSCVMANAAQPLQDRASQAIALDVGHSLVPLQMPLSCTRYLSPWKSQDVLPSAILVVSNAEQQVLENGAVVYRIPPAAQRAELMQRNGMRPGSDFHFTVEKAATGIGFFWFEERFATRDGRPDYIRTELLTDQDGRAIAFTSAVKLQRPDPSLGVAEFTVRCEALSQSL